MSCFPRLEPMVFCDDCGYEQHYRGMIAVCGHHQNIRYIPDPFRLRLEYKQTPEAINQNNDCKWFVQKEKRLWLKIW